MGIRIIASSARTNCWLSSNSCITGVSGVGFRRFSSYLPVRTIHTISSRTSWTCRWRKARLYFWLNRTVAPFWTVWWTEAWLQWLSWRWCILFGSWVIWAIARWRVDTVRTDIVSAWTSSSTFWETLRSLGFRQSFSFTHNCQSLELKFKVIFYLIDLNPHFLLL